MFKPVSTGADVGDVTASSDRATSVAAPKWSRASALGQLTVLALFGAALVGISRSPGRKSTDALREQARQLAGAATSEIESTLWRLGPLVSRLQNDEPLEWREFQALGHDGAPAGAAAFWAWAPRVPKSRRAEYERSTGRDAYRSFRLFEIDPRGSAVAARPRAEHYPLQLVAPLPEGDALLGMDLAARPEIAAAIARTRARGEPEVLAPIALAGEAPPRRTCLGGASETACRSLLLVLAPVFGPGRGGQRGELLGVALAGVPWSSVAAAAAGPRSPGRMDVPALGASALAGLARLTPPDPNEPSHAEARTDVRALADPIGIWRAVAPVYVHGRLWQLELAAPGVVGGPSARLRR